MSNIVARAVGMDGRISPKFLHAGPGYGGSCFPKDTNALVKIGDNYNVNMSLVKEVINSNQMQKIRMVEKVENIIGDLNNKCIAVLGLAFKSETDDIRESPSVTIIDRLLKSKVRIQVHDPKALENAKNIFYDKIIYCNNVLQAVKGADVLIIATEWNEYRSMDLNKIAELMKTKIIIDTRNMLNPKNAKDLGFIYEGVGRK